MCSFKGCEFLEVRNSILYPSIALGLRAVPLILMTVPVRIISAVNNLSHKKSWGGQDLLY